MIPFSWTADNKCQVMLWKSSSLAEEIVELRYNAALSVIDINFRVDHAKISAVWKSGALVASSILSDIHHGIRISLSMCVVTVIGVFLSLSLLPSVGEKKNKTRKTATAWLKQERERFKLRSRYSFFRCGGQFFVNSLPQGVVLIELKLSRKATKMLYRHAKV